MIRQDVVTIGGGPAGLAAAIGAKQAGAENVLILERDCRLGGILNQCIHNGFGLHMFKEELTGPEYAERFVRQAEELNIPSLLNTMVLDISQGENGDKIITAVNREGLLTIQTKAAVLSMGCRERPRGALNIPGYRPAGIYSAGTAQHFVNIDGIMPGREVVILGSGDIGLIMARRMTLEGAKVKVVAELMPYSGGLKRNIVQCLDDYGIPLKLSHTVTAIHGKKRLEGVTLARVDENRKPVPGTEEYISCDTLLLSVGLIPENELSAGMGVTTSPVTSGPVVSDNLETNISGVFACGNVLHVHDLVDYVTEEALHAGKCAADYAGGKVPGQGREIKLCPEGGVRYTVPAFIRPDEMEEKVTVRFRVGNVYQNQYLSVYFDDRRVLHRRRPVMAPGEMEEVTIKRKDILEMDGLNQIRITIEEA
ncbi:NAD(P)/FAD-dependent oxidoreductase [Anaerolentibacter hominis]|uniref:NAD(P)/FAD-dependent oxidoreductase n=1 Tax=Anaerolentibacter hominis TaxID=3079009 RepID=UPI0031B86456